MKDLIQKALTAAGYDHLEPTEDNLRMCFEDYVDGGVWDNISLEDIEEMTVKEMCVGLINLR